MPGPVLDAAMRVNNNPRPSISCGSSTTSCPVSRFGT